MRSGNVRLVALLVAAVLPVVAIASTLVLYVAMQERRAVEAETRARVTRLVDLVDREMRANLRVLEALATLTNLDGPDLPAFHDEVRRTLASQPGWLTIILLGLDGWQLLSARLPLDRPPARVVEPPESSGTRKSGAGWPINWASAAPALRAASSTARRSTSVMADGTQMTTRGRLNRDTPARFRTAATGVPT